LEQVSWNLGDWYEVDEEKLVVDSRDEMKHTERNDQCMVDVQSVDTEADELHVTVATISYKYQLSLIDQRDKTVL